jgi:hypothetical protein
VTCDEAVDFLNRNGVDPGYYELGGLGAGEIWGIEKAGARWQVYFSERGDKRNPKTFGTESEAVAFFLEKVSKTISEFEGRTLPLPPTAPSEK